MCVAKEMVGVIWKGFRIDGQGFEPTNMWNHPGKRVIGAGLFDVRVVNLVHIDGRDVNLCLQLRHTEGSCLWGASEFFIDRTSLITSNASCLSVSTWNPKGR